MSVKQYHAEYIDEYQFGYKCDSCPKYHRHGNCLDYKTNRVEHRGCHCEKVEGDVEIIIDENTIRRLSRRERREYNKYLQNQS
jgi:hypothetical protein